MRANAVVSNKGQITLPVDVRKHLGLSGGDVVMLEERDGGLFLRPATVVPYRIYTDEEIAQWQKENEWKPGEKEKFLKRWGRAKK